MPIITSRPIPDPEGGADYDRLAPTLAMAPRFNGCIGMSGMSVAVRLTPYRESEDGLLQPLESGTQAVVYGDAMEAAKSDRALARCILKIEAALQEFINAKNL